MFFVMREAISSGVIDLLEEESLPLDELLSATELMREEGARFIALLVEVGLLEQYAGRYSLSRFSRTYLSRLSATSQRQVMAFEPLLLENWQKLGVVLQKGQGVLGGEQPPDEYRRRLHLFQQAMAEAAKVRSRELWEAITPLPEQGTIIDIGAGDGTYLREFLARHPAWLGIACDLPDVCREATAAALPANLSFYPCNILDRQELADLVTSHGATADLLLFSNICHCYSKTENEALLLQAGALLVEAGRLIVHDFYRDANGFGAMYDLHMLVNTYNGRSYTIAETAAMVQNAGFGQNEVIELPSRSLAMVASRSQPFARPGYRRTAASDRH
jgi:SAM-dependent methyltransferase